jgi:hypothetical protein
MKYKTPICHKCGKVLKGKVPDDATEITCFFCDNPPYEDEEQGLKHVDKTT